ncbi:MAG: nucleoside-triphosphatase [Chitinophagaceae bacterium]
MQTQPTSGPQSLIYYRLIALWALTEAMLGGIIHGLRIPVSGLVVGSCAVICICLIGWYVPKKGSILKATIIVAVFKMMLSPQAPPPAYVAVFFQGLMGELLFWNRRFYRLSCILLALLSLLESGFQRILMLTIIYGKDFWTVLNDFINGLTKQKVATNYSLLIGTGYVSLHLIMGVLVGWWASVLPKRIIKWRNEGPHNIIISSSAPVDLPESTKKRSKFQKGVFVMWILLILLYVQSYYKIGDPLLPPHVSLQILLRSIIIVLTWYFLISPLIKGAIHRWLQKRKTKSQPDIQKVLELLPDTQQLAAKSWMLSGKTLQHKRGWSRLIATGKTILVNALNTDFTRQIVILTAPVQTGKTTALVIWSQERTDVTGILSPVIDGKRFFMNAKSREVFAMEATPGESAVLIVGKFAFSKKGFEKATQVIYTGMTKQGWLVIDEIGPMELNNEGFCEVLKKVLAEGYEKQTILLVVREGLANEVKKVFGINNAIVIRSVAGLRQ